jgi:hypothetical protein
MQQPQAGVEQKASVFIPKTPLCSFGERVMRTTQKARKASEDPLFAKSSAWTPPYQAWQERAKSARKLVERVRDGQAKNLLVLIAETYERLAQPL